MRKKQLNKIIQLKVLVNNKFVCEKKEGVVYVAQANYLDKVLESFVITIHSKATINHCIK